LISFLKLSGRAIVKLGPWPFRIKTAEGRMRRSIAEGVFFTQADDFRRGLAPHSTGVSWPVLVPLQIDVLDDGLTSKESYRPVKSVRIALFDVSGEHFKPFPPSGIEYRSGPMDLQTLLRSFQGGLSMLYMGPTTRLSGYTNNGSRAEPHETDDARDRVREDPDSNLVNAIRAYDNGRSSFRLDRHLFVLAKWDLAVPVDDPSFDRPKMRVVIGEIEKRFPEAWATFKALPATAKAKMVRQYCAGIISNRTVTIFPSGSRERELLDGHSKAMWNWIYRGATRSPDCPDGMDLFQDSTHNRFRFWQNFFR
jgi:hypothetical protein